MKLLKIGEDFYNVNAIVRITPLKQGYFKIQLADGNSFPVTEHNLTNIISFISPEILETEKADVPHD